jgi:ribosomal RNA assembly protein
MATESILIPEERKSALIGREGRTKAYLEKATSTRITVGDGVEIEGEPVAVMTAHNIILAIARGFAPKEAALLLDEEYCIDVISLRGETHKAEKRLMARVIGRSGQAKKTIEDETGARLAIYGKTVSIIGTVSQLAHAREAVKLLLKGKTHAYVFKRMKEGL